ncbi:MAG: insulinase family protein [Syntrophales bacterium]|jgi:predicted Zn-dependent peptidase|nr:insulinase family protein [Syntrophales bacterium]MCK9528225.1 insulinase family protein [Syntrophales bacterium]MDX9921373.1 pitrilysin family protein [Syntrophales bacterium]
MNKKFPWLVTVLLLILPLVGCAPASSPLLKDPENLLYPPLRFDPPRAERFELDNGMTLFFLEDREIPLVRLSLAARAGSVYDPPGREGLAEIAGSVMRTGGTPAMSPDEFDDELDYRAIDLDVSVTAQTLLVTLTVAEDYFDDALALLGNMMMTPLFDPERLELARRIKIEELKRLPDNPQALAFREFTKLLYRDSSWGRPPSIASVEALTRDDCLDFLSRHLSPDTIMISVSGAVTAEEAKTKLSKHFGSWRAAAPLPPVEAPSPSVSGPLRHIHREVPQSVIVIGHIGPGKKSADYYAMTVLDFIVGGGFRSLMFLEIRTRKGLAYSTGTLYNPRSDFGVLAAYAMTGPDTTASVIESTLSILETVKVRPVDEETLRWARNALTNSHIFSFLSPHQIALGQMMDEFEGLPPDFLRRYPEGINAVTADDLQRVAATWLDGGYRTIVVLGDSSRFDQPLSRFGTSLKLDSDLVVDPGEEMRVLQTKPHQIRKNEKPCP